MCTNYRAVILNRVLRCPLIILVAVVLIASIGGCGNATKDRSYRSAKSVTPIKIPSELTLEVGKDVLDVPDIQTQSSISDDKLELPPTLDIPLDDLPSDSQENKKLSNAAVDTAEDADSLDTSELKIRLTQDEQAMPYLIVNAAVKSLWPNVSAWVEKLGFEVKDKNIANLTYDIYKKLPVTTFNEKKLLPGEQGKPDAYESYQLVLVEAQKKQTYIKLRDKEGRDDGSALARHLLLQLKAQAEQK